MSLWPRNSNTPAALLPRSLALMPHVAVTACFFGSGFLALVYEICWIRKASLVFGSTNYALSTVLAVFFGGLAIGSYLFGRWASRSTRPLRLYGLVEVAVGALAALSPITMECAESIFGRVYPAIQHNFAALSFARFALLAVILAPPAVLMGGTLPLFCRQYVRRHSSVVRWVGCLYGVNTIGAALGCLICGFWLIQHVGMAATLVGGGLINVLLGLIVLFVSRQVGDVAARDRPVKEMRPDLHPGNVRSPILYGLFFAIGFVGLANEVLWTRFFSLLFHGTVHTYTLTLTVVLAGIVLGSLLSAFVLHRFRQRALVFGFIQVVNGLVVLTVLLMPSSTWDTWKDVNLPILQMWLIALVLLVPAILSGASFPLAIDLATHDPGRSSTSVGRMTAVNTCGGILGSLVIGFMVLPAWGLYASLLLSSGLSLATGLAAWWWLVKENTQREKRLLAFASFALWIAVPSLTGTSLPQDHLAVNGELIECCEGLNSNLAIVEAGGSRRLEVDRLWQGEDRKTHQIMAAHLPMLFHTNPKEVLVVGLGVGQTTSRFLMYPIRQLHCVDIESALVPLIRRHFESRWLDDPRFELIVEDGRNYLANADQQYDLISIEVGQTFRPGVAAFYSEEFYQQADQRLRNGGLLAQFVSLDFLSPEQFTRAIRTFLNIFPESTLWYNRSELLLIGVKGGGPPRICPHRLHQIATHAAISCDLQFDYWGGKQRWLNRKDHLLAGFLMGPTGLAKLAGTAPAYHDDPPELEYAVSLDNSIDHAAVVSQVQSCLQPVQVVLEDPLKLSVAKAIAAGRQRNLNNILANDLLWRASRLVQRGDLEQASELAWEAVGRNPENFGANLLYADIRAAQSEYNEAIAHYQTALEIMPKSARAHRGIARALHTVGRLDEARSHLHAFQQSRPR